MLLAPKKGFVFLAMTKSASTSIERAFGRHSALTAHAAWLKHVPYRDFQGYLEPLLAEKDFPRESYEVACVMREPVDWLFSWWRYRSRHELAGSRRRYAGGVPFEEFARLYMRHHRGEPLPREARFAQLGRQSAFVEPVPGGRPIDRIFRYDRLDLAVDFLAEKVKERVELGLENVSPERTFSLSPEVERELRAFLAPETSIYERAISS